MKNSDKFELVIKPIINTNSDFAKVHGKICFCKNTNCAECDFQASDCTINKVKWLLAECYDLSKLEYEILKEAKNLGYKYIARNDVPNNNMLYLFREVPIKDTMHHLWERSKSAADLKVLNTFDFITWKSGLVSIEELLMHDLKEK